MSEYNCRKTPSGNYKICEEDKGGTHWFNLHCQVGSIYHFDFNIRDKGEGFYRKFCENVPLFQEESDDENYDVRQREDGSFEVRVRK